MKGKVKFFNEMKGFGFIAGEDGKEYFVHQTGLGAGVSLQENDDVTFTVEQGDRGPKAANVVLDKGDAAEETTEEAPEEASEEAPEETSEEATEEPEEEKTEE